MSSSSLASPVGPGDAFLSSAYRNLSKDSSKLDKLMSHVTTHAMVEQFPAFPGQWILQSDAYGNTQFVRLDQIVDSNNRESGIRGRLKGNYPKSIKPKEEDAAPKEEENGRVVIKEMGSEREIAYIVPLEEYEVTASTPGKKRKGGKKNKKRKGRKSTGSARSTVEEEEGTVEDKASEDNGEREGNVEVDVDVDVDVVLGSNSETSVEGDGKSSVVVEGEGEGEDQPVEVPQIEILPGPSEHDDTQGDVPETEIPLPPRYNEESQTPPNTNIDVTQHQADDIIQPHPIPVSQPTSPIVVRLPPSRPDSTSLPSQRQHPFPDNIIYFGDIPTTYFNSSEATQQAESEPLSFTHSDISSTVEDNIATPTIDSLDAFSRSPERELSRTSTMSNPTPPQSPPSGEGEIVPSTAINMHKIIYSEPTSTVERPPTPPPEVDEDEEDGTLVFPSDPPKITPSTTPNIPTTTNLPTPSFDLPPIPIPSITLNTPTSPATYISSTHPLTHSWTLLFSNTSHKHPYERKVSMPPLSPLNPLSNHPNASDYSSHLITLFQADNLEDLFGGWKALRRSIAKSKGRVIEPLGDTNFKDGPGLGTHLFQEDSNFHFFKSHIRPMWEDRWCQRGGKLMVSGDPKSMDDVFFDLILSMISGDLEEEVPPPPSSSSTICGIALSRRKITRIEIWLGGENTVPDRKWVEQMSRYLEKKYGEYKVYGYKSFGKN